MREIGCNAHSLINCTLCKTMDELKRLRAEVEELRAEARHVNDILNAALASLENAPDQFESIEKLRQYVADNKLFQE